MWAQFLRRSNEIATISVLAVARVRNVTCMAVWIAEMKPGGRRVIEFVRWQVVAEHVAPVVCEPKLMGLRMPRKAHRIANTRCKRFAVGTIRVHTHNLTKSIFVADITWRANADVELAVGAKRYVTPAVMTFRRQIDIEYLAVRNIRQIFLDSGVTDDPAFLGNIQIALVKRDSVRCIQAANEFYGTCRITLGHDGIDRMPATIGNEYRAVVAQCQRACVGDISKNRYRKPGR